MATAAVEHAPSTGPGTFVEPRQAEQKQQAKHDVTTLLNYYKDESGVGAPPPPAIVGHVRSYHYSSYGPVTNFSQET
jgi:hypothetical protein